VFAVVDERDVLIQLPYHSFDPVMAFFDEAASDPAVEAVWASLYRIPRDSGVARRLIDAVRNGKKVTAFVEVQARFDEESNLEWADRMVEAGVRVLFSRPGIKVHTKLALVARRRDGERRLHAYLGTGNFNESTARVYADLGLFTSDPRLTEEVLRVFEYLGGAQPESGFAHLLVAPLEMRERFRALVEVEMANARAGREARMILKMNSLEDSEMIELLYEASRAGVEVDIIVRGICRLVPGVPGVSERIRARSIVDRCLEHARAYVFHNGGDPLVFAASADWMTRNLDRRVEVAFPIYHEDVRAQVMEMLRLQLADNVRARLIDAEQVNQFVRGVGRPVRAQIDLYAKLAPGALPAGVP
jgi:polyphosphate kinase